MDTAAVEHALVCRCFRLFTGVVAITHTVLLVTRTIAYNAVMLRFLQFLIGLVTIKIILIVNFSKINYQLIVNFS